MQVAGCGKPVLLIHGFGASIGHFRKNIPALVSAGYKVAHAHVPVNVMPDNPEILACACIDGRACMLSQHNLKIALWL